MTTSSSPLLGVLAALALGPSCSAPSTAQIADLGGTGELAPRSWTAGVHVIGTTLTETSGDVDATPIAGTDARLNGWGAEAATLGDRFTWLIGFDERTLEDDVNFFEVYGGSKLNLFRRGDWSPYLIGTIRYSQDLRFPTDPPTASDDFFGWSAGGGLTYYATERFFLEARVAYEGLFEDIDARAGRTLDISGLVATFGAGFTF